MLNTNQSFGDEGTRRVHVVCVQDSLALAIIIELRVLYFSAVGVH